MIETDDVLHVFVKMLERVKETGVVYLFSLEISIEDLEPRALEGIVVRAERGGKERWIETFLRKP